jgi:hypothetical protein
MAMFCHRIEVEAEARSICVQAFELTHIRLFLTDLAFENTSLGNRELRFGV